MSTTPLAKEPSLSPAQLKRARELFPFTSTGKVYLNHAGTGPLSTRVVQAVERHLVERSAGPIDTYQADSGMIRSLRTSLAMLVGAESYERISLQANTSEAINIIAAGLRWKTGDRILVNDLEFPANVYPYLNLHDEGVELDTIHTTRGMVTLESITKAMTPRTRLLALSAVQFLTGHRADLEEIGAACRARGIIFAVDGIQGVGAVKIDVQAMHIDALAAGAQKWQMAPHGTGFLYLTEELQSRIHQRSLGWLSVKNPWDFQNYHQPLAPSARRYEGGSLNLPGLHGYEAAIRTLLEFNPPAIEHRILDLTTRLLGGLTEIRGSRVLTPEDPRERAGIVSLRIPEGIDGGDLLSRLEEESIFPAIREGKLRFSPHFYNTVEEMERTLEVTRQLLRKP